MRSRKPTGFTTPKPETAMRLRTPFSNLPFPLRPHSKPNAKSHGELAQHYVAVRAGERIVEIVFRFIGRPRVEQISNTEVDGQAGDSLQVRLVHAINAGEVVEGLRRDSSAL